MAVIKLKSGKWQAIVSYRDENGNSKKKKKSFLSRREAKDFEYNFMNVPKEEEIEKVVTYEYIFENYLIWNSKTANQRTILDKKNMAKRFWSDKFDWPIEDLTPNVYLEIQNTIYLENFSVSRMNKYTILLMSVATFASKFYGYENHANCLETIGQVKRHKDNIKALSPEELNLFIDHVDKEIYKILFRFLYYTGLRIGEARALQVKDIQNGSVTINKSIRSAKQGFNPPKNSSSYRTNRLDDATLLSLKPLLNQKEDHFIFGGLQPLSMRQIDNARIVAIRSANIPYFVTHTLRHSFGSYLLSLGVNIKAVSVYMGHSSTDTTTRVYEHLMKSTEDEMMRVLNNRQ